MEQKTENNEKKPLKLNIKRTCVIGFAFFGILLLWQVYDSWCSPLLTNLLTKVFNASDATEVSYLVGCIMALDNLAALILLPIFGHLSDKTKTRIGKRMPYILVGTIVSAIAFPFVPVAFYYNNVLGAIILMAIVVLFMMMYRNPAVSLMPDMTPKPLRSKANGIINIMGYVGGAFATVLGIFLPVSEYINGKSTSIWWIETPFLVASILMIISCAVLFILIKENKIALEVEEEMKRGEEEAEVATKVEEDKPMSKENKIMLILILVAEFFWFMADNGISTFMNNYTIFHLGVKSSNTSTSILIGGVASVVGFAVGGIIASKIGRKWTLTSGLFLTLAAYLLWAVFTFTIPAFEKGSGTYHWFIHVIYFVKGFGMSLVHVNSYPMVVELCPSSKIGKFTGYYYASSMAAQTITPIALGSFMLIDGIDYSFMPFYALGCLAISTIVFLFIKNVKTTKTDFKKGLEALGDDD